MKCVHILIQESHNASISNSFHSIVSMRKIAATFMSCTEAIMCLPHKLSPRLGNQHGMGDQSALKHMGKKCLIDPSFYYSKNHSLALRMSATYMENIV